MHPLRRVSRGAAFGDVDNDGDVDVLVTTNGGPVQLLLNQSAQRRQSVAVRLRGTRDNADGLGARVGLAGHGGTTVWRRVHTDGSYLSSSDPRVMFGVEQGTERLTVVVDWPRESREVWRNVAPDRVVTLTQGTGLKTTGKPVR